MYVVPFEAHCRHGCPHHHLFAKTVELPRSFRWGDQIRPPLALGWPDLVASDFRVARSGAPKVAVIDPDAKWAKTTPMMEVEARRGDPMNRIAT
uniref:Uncharacterized protein n=1 Tax=Oryza nivara TaxID=4536 RepID=A0A0E0HYH0_ORYNI